MRLRAAALLLLAVTLALPPARGEEAYERVEVVDPYLELHTGPGRGYPVFYVVERGEQIEILKRRTDWFKVHTADGKEGWASREQLETTITAAGVKKSFRDVLLDDYLSRRFELGFAGGALENDPLMVARAGYKISENLTAELTIGQASGDFSSSTLYYVGLRSEPLADKRLSPFLALGVGRFENTPRATAVERITTKSDLANAGLGVNYYLTRRFVFRADFKRHVVFIDENRIDDYDEWSLGFSFFF